MKNNSISLRLSLKYMSIVALITVLVCIFVTGAMVLRVKQIRSKALKDSSARIISAVQKNGVHELDFVELPYFVDFTVWDSETARLIYTTDSLLPALNLKAGKVSEYFEKDFYSDSNLKLAVLISEFSGKNGNFRLQCSMDIENDSLSGMIKSLPGILLLCFIPILVSSFLISLLISKKTIAAFNRLESAFEKEKSFSGNVSHELKTPLSIIDGHANLIKRWGKENPEQLEKSIDVILEETRNITGIIQTLLELSKIENQTIQTEKTTFYATNLFVQLRQEFTSVYEELNFLIEDEDFMELTTDQKILHQILTAIISNSVKFAGKDCTVKISCRRTNGRTCISVQDNGPGISEEIIPYIFERFYKGDKSHTRNGSGAGLGLSIAKSLIQTLKGEIKAGNGSSGGALIELFL